VARAEGFVEVLVAAGAGGEKADPSKGYNRSTDADSSGSCATFRRPDGSTKCLLTVSVIEGFPRAAGLISRMGGFARRSGKFEVRRCPSALSPDGLNAQGKLKGLKK
jgi:hypothetical protein